MMKLRINPFVVTDLKEIRNFIAEDNEVKAQEIINSIYNIFEEIRCFPNIGTDLAKRVSFPTEHKYLVWKDYIILYKVNELDVEVYRVVNRYQDFTRLFKEQPEWKIETPVCGLNHRLGLFFAKVLPYLQSNLFRWEDDADINAANKLKTKEFGE